MDVNVNEKKRSIHTLFPYTYKSIHLKNRWNFARRSLWKGMQTSLYERRGCNSTVLHRKFERSFWSQAQNYNGVCCPNFVKIYHQHFFWTGTLQLSCIRAYNKTCQSKRVYLFSVQKWTPQSMRKPIRAPLFLQ